MQVPVTYAVSGTSPVRCGGVVQAPYTLINTSSEHTVWVSHNAGMGIGQGTPLFPGATLVWQHDGDFYAICEDAVEGVQVIATKDAIDIDPNPVALAVAILNSGLLLVDNPENIFVDNIDAGNGFTTGRLDIRRFQSVVVGIQYLVAGPGNEDTAQIRFYATETGGVIHHKTIQFDGHVWEASIPVLGAYMEILSSTGTEFQVHVTASHRDIDQIIQTITNPFPTILGASQIDTNFYSDLVTLLNTQAFSLDFPPWFGEIEFSVAAGAGVDLRLADNRVSVNRRNPDTGNYNLFRVIPWINMNNIAPTPTRWQAVARIPCSGDCFNFNIINNSGVTLSSMAVRVAPVSGYGPVQ